MLRIAGQAAFVAVLLLVLREMYLNIAFQLDERGTDLSFDFLDSRAGFAIKESIFNYGANQPFLRAFIAGATNAMLVAGVGIVLTTLLGVAIGVGRLSPNWLVRKITQVYVEVIRNTPALVQVVFWYVAVILAIPQIRDSISLGGVAFISNRGLAVPAVRGGDDFGLWWLLVFGGVVAGLAARGWRTRVHERTGRPHYRTLVLLGVVVGVSVAAYVLVGDAFGIDLPKLRERSYSGGIQVSPEFAGILIALVVYTAAFIGEIVRGSILA
ncbi:MAG TPA: ABC transporter permease subunit, partial [Actinomycetota bacterium]|nr:ABC transporter permease subunit [Actinomycetota bacterium]